jgi:hypothetical protein
MLPAPFCCSHFSDSVFHFCPGLASFYNPPTYASHIARIIDVSQHT